MAVFPDGAGWSAHCVYAAVKTKIDALEHQARDDILTWEVNGTKRAHLLTSSYSRLLTPRLRIAGVVALDPTAASDEPWTRLHTAEARNRVAPSTVGPLVFDQLTVLQRMGSLLSRTPCYLLPRRQQLDSTVSDLDSILSAGALAGAARVSHA